MWDGIINVVLLVILIGIVGYLVFANNGFYVLLPLAGLSALIWMVLVLFNLDHHEWLKYFIASIPWVGVAIYQVVEIYLKISNKKDE
jgi:hypothetical protein